MKQYVLYDSENLSHTSTRWTPRKVFALAIVLCVTLITTSLFGGYYIGKHLNKYNLIAESELIVLRNYDKKFSENALRDVLIELNLRFPDIVFAQAVIESGNFKSKIFVENNNMFGMRQAVKRVNTADGTQYNHAYYKDWYSCVIDYAFWQATYADANKIKSREEYLDLLQSIYAEDPSYRGKIDATAKKFASTFK